MAIGLVNDAMSKTVSGVIGDLGRLERTIAVRFAEYDLVAVEDQHDSAGAVARLDRGLNRRIDALQPLAINRRGLRRRQ